jgi:hypothetical protein
MRLFGILGGGWNINFSQQTPGEYEHLTRVHDVAGFQLGRALSLGPGVFIGLLRRPRVEPEIERCRSSSENLTIGSASTMTGVDANGSHRPASDVMPT